MSEQTRVGLGAPSCSWPGPPHLLLEPRETHQASESRRERGDKSRGPSGLGGSHSHLRGSSEAPVSLGFPTSKKDTLKPASVAQWLGVNL